MYFHSEETSDGEKRFLRTKPSEKWIAGDRTKRLLYADPIEIGEGNNWEKIEEAFNKSKIAEKKQGVLLGAKE